MAAPITAFIPEKNRDNLPDATFSFPGHLGSAEHRRCLIQLSQYRGYDKYRRDVAEDEDCKAAAFRFKEPECFSSYDRAFLLPMFEWRCPSGPASPQVGVAQCPPDHTLRLTA